MRRRIREAMRQGTPAPLGTMTAKREPTQSEKFKQIARELGCDEDEATFDSKLIALTN